MVTIDKQKITPEIAKNWLSKNGKNRKVTDRNVTFLANQIISNSWKITGDPIKFDIGGNLIDGQHRLSAIIKANKPIELYVAKGLESDIFDVLDTGRSRSAGDVLSASGYKAYNHLSSLAKGILLFEKGNLQNPHKSSKYTASNQEILKLVKSKPELEEIVPFIMNEVYYHFRPIGPAILGTIYYQVSHKNQTKADQFFQKYALGVDLKQNDPIRVLRARLLRDQTNKTKLNTRDKYALVIMTWNAYIKGKEIESLSLRTGYEFPKIV